MISAGYYTLFFLKTITNLLLILLKPTKISTFHILYQKIICFLIFSKYFLFYIQYPVFLLPP